MNQKLEQRRRCLEDGRGSAILECAVVLPILLLIVLGGFEIAGSLSAVQAANYLSREVAIATYRDCAFDHSSADAHTSPNSYLNAGNCLQIVVARYQEESALLLPNTEFALSLYNLEGGVPRQTALVKTGTAETKYSTANFSSTTTPLDRSFADALSLHGTVVVSEVYVPKESVRGSLSRYWSYSFLPGTASFLADGAIHAATVL